MRRLRKRKIEIAFLLDSRRMWAGRGSDKMSGAISVSRVSLVTGHCDHQGPGNTSPVTLPVTPVSHQHWHQNM